MQIRVSVTTKINEITVDSLSGVPATFEGTYMPTLEELKKKSGGDRYKVLNSSGPAEVRIGLEERVSGPPNTYSSVSVYVQVMAHCDQTAPAIRQAMDLVHSECVQALERYVEPAQQLLLAHLGRSHG